MFYVRIQLSVSHNLQQYMFGSYGWVTECKENTIGGKELGHPVKHDKILSRKHQVFYTKRWMCGVMYKLCNVEGSKGSGTYIDCNFAPKD